MASRQEAELEGPHGTRGYAGELHVVERFEDGDGSPVWELASGLAYTSVYGRTYEVPAGTRTNFASVPFFLTWVVSRTGRHNKADVVHDYMWGQADCGLLDRRLADEVFRDGLSYLGVSWLRRWMMWTGVRQGGLVKSRPGSWPLRDIIVVVLITVLVAPIVIPVSAGVLAGRVALWCVDFVPSMLRDRGAPVSDEL